MFKNEVSEFIYKRTYSRWREEDKRREDWPETIERFLGFIISERPKIPEKTINKIRKYMLGFAVMPSMRFLWAAGPAAKEEVVEEKVEEKAEPKVKLVKIKRFNKTFNRREEMEVPEDDLELTGYYADILVE